MPTQEDPPRPARAAAATSFDHRSPELSEESLWRAYDEVRGQGPVARSAAHGGYYVVAGFDDVRSALRDSDTFSSAGGFLIPTIGVPRTIPIDYDPPLHTEYRRVMTQALTPGRVRSLEPFLRSLVRELVADFHETGGGDAVRRVALPLPLRVLTEVIGFSPTTVARLRELTEQMWRDVADLDYDGARKDIRTLVDGEISRHRDDDLDDYVTSVLDAVIDDRPITDDEVARILMTLAIAGHETTMNAASSLMWLVASDDARQEDLRADPSRAPQFVEEMLRLRSPAQNFARRTERPADVDGVGIPEHCRVLLSYAAANRDPRKFPQADSFDVSRATRGHLAFGWGIHQCLGAALARSELRILLETLCEFPPLRPAGEAEFGSPHGGAHYGPLSVPLTFAC